MQALKSGADEFSIFSVCQAHAQLEADYNVGGILQERPSNQRRSASTGVQLSRMKYRAPYAHVDITCTAKDSDGDEDEVRYIYCANALKWDLPIDADLAKTMERIFTDEALEPFRERLAQAKATGHWAPSEASTAHFEQPAG